MNKTYEGNCPMQRPGDIRDSCHGASFVTSISLLGCPPLVRDVVRLSSTHSAYTFKATTKEKMKNKYDACQTCALNLALSC